MNRVTGMIDKLQPRIDALTPNQLAEMDKASTFAFDEYTALMTRNSLAAVSGKLSIEESQMIYGYCGEGGPAKVNGQPLAVRLTLTMILGELMGSK